MTDSVLPLITTGHGAAPPVLPAMRADCQTSSASSSRRENRGTATKRARLMRVGFPRFFATERRQGRPGSGIHSHWR